MGGRGSDIVYSWMINEQRRKPRQARPAQSHATVSAGSRCDDPYAARLLDRLQFLAGFEADCLAGRNVDFRAGARVSPDAGLAWPHGEDAEAAQLDAIAVRQRSLHAVEHSFDRHFRFGFGNAGPGDDFVDQIQFDHKWLRYVRSPGEQSRTQALQRFYPTRSIPVSLSSTSSYEVMRES